MSEPYHYWKFKGAVEGLAESEAPLRKRLEYALVGMAAVRDEDLPPEIMETWLELRAHSTWKTDGDPLEGTFANTMAELTDDDARAVVKLIVKLFELTCRRLEREPPDDAGL